MTICSIIISGWSLLDPSLEEEECAEGHVTLFLHSNGTINQLIHTGVSTPL